MVARSDGNAKEESVVSVNAGLDERSEELKKVRKSGESRLTQMSGSAITSLTFKNG